MDNIEIIKLDISIQEQQDPRFKVVEFHGEFDSYSLQNVREKILTLVESLPQDILVFHFGNLHFVNSESISFMLQIQELLQNHKKKLVIVQARPNVKDVLKVIGLFDSIPYFANLLDFIHSL